MGDGPGEARARLDELAAGVWGVAAVAACAANGMLEALRAPATAADVAAATGVPEAVVTRLLDVLAALGFASAGDEGRWSLAGGLDALASPDGLRILHADLVGTVLQPADLVRTAATAPARLAEGWRTTDDLVLTAQGVLSSAAVPLLARHAFPHMGDVAERLERPGAALLDVGAGVAALSIAMCERYPHLRAVGVEPQDAPLALARDAVAAAGLADRVELRQCLVQDVRDEAAFDLVWLPGNFLPPEILREALERAFVALRPGGWVLMATLGGGADDLAGTTARLRASLWGGGAIPPDDLEALAGDAGFGEVRRMPRLGSGLLPLLLGKPPA